MWREVLRAGLHRPILNPHRPTLTPQRPTPIPYRHMFGFGVIALFITAPGWLGWFLLYSQYMGLNRLIIFFTFVNV